MTQTTSVPLKNQKHKPSSDEWREIWLEKMERACIANKLTKPTISGFCDFIGRYLGPHKDHPGMITTDATAEFLAKNSTSEKQANFCRNALVFFYSNVVSSEKHVEVLKQTLEADTFQPQKHEQNIVSPEKVVIPIILSAPKLPDKDSIAFYLKNMHTELKVRNYSPRTTKNYGATVNQYLHWLQTSPSEKDVPEIKRFQLYLKEDRKNSPRTVNLVTAAIQFFYLNVLRFRLPLETLPRMKTGRSLPKVYSEQDIEKLLKSVENSKHRLLLMLAYGCGLRLEELRTLKISDFDFHKDLLRLEQGKGKKDRTIMLDPSIKEQIKIYVSKQ
jgi:integrase